LCLLVRDQQHARRDSRIYPDSDVLGLLTVASLGPSATLTQAPIFGPRTGPEEGSESHFALETSIGRHYSRIAIFVKVFIRTGEAILQVEYPKLASDSPIHWSRSAF
jgi:hypothetical protein